MSDYIFTKGDSYPPSVDGAATAGINVKTANMHWNGIEIKISCYEAHWDDEKALELANELRDFVLSKLTGNVPSVLLKEANA